MSKDDGNWIWKPGSEKTHSELCVTPIGEYDSILYHGADWPMDEKHKRLIAVAPDLLSACKGVKQRICFIGMPSEPMTADGFPDWVKEIALLEAAIAKAVQQ